MKVRTPQLTNSDSLIYLVKAAGRGELKRTYAGSCMLGRPVLQSSQSP